MRLDSFFFKETAPIWGFGASAQATLLIFYGNVCLYSDVVCKSLFSPRRLFLIKRPLYLCLERKAKTGAGVEFLQRAKEAIKL